MSPPEDDLSTVTDDDIEEIDQLINESFITSDSNTSTETDNKDTFAFKSQ